MSTKSVSKPVPSACPECGRARVVAEALNTVRVARADVGALRQASANNDSEFWALVCPDCGHTTLFAKTPARLLG